MLQTSKLSNNNHISTNKNQVTFPNVTFLETNEFSDAIELLLVSSKSCKYYVMLSWLNRIACFTRAGPNGMDIEVSR